MESLGIHLHILLVDLAAGSMDWDPGPRKSQTTWQTRNHWPHKLCIRHDRFAVYILLACHSCNPIILSLHRSPWAPQDHMPPPEVFRWRQLLWISGHHLCASMIVHQLSHLPQLLDHIHTALWLPHWPQSAFVRAPMHHICTIGRCSIPEKTTNRIK